MSDLTEVRDMNFVEYYTLIARLDKGYDYEILFGDYDRQVVEDEMHDSMDGESPYMAYLIITTESDQASIDTRLATINGLIPQEEG